VSNTIKTTPSSAFTGLIIAIGDYLAQQASPPVFAGLMNFSAYYLGRDCAAHV
jgi:hypothetical protein